MIILEIFAYIQNEWSLDLNGNVLLTSVSKPRASPLLLACKSLILKKQNVNINIQIKKITWVTIYIIAFLSSSCFFLPYLSKDSSFLLSQRIFKACFNILSDASTLTTSKPLFRSKTESILEKKMNLLEIFECLVV